MAKSRIFPSSLTQVPIAQITSPVGSPLAKKNKPKDSLQKKRIIEKLKK